MADTLTNLLLGFQVALAPSVLLYAFLGCLIGTVVGVLPGLGPLAAISILLPLSYGLPTTTAIVLLAGIYYGAMYGGSTTSILMRIPGEAASVVTCIDGYEMTRRGRAGPALAIAAIGSFVAGTLSVVGPDAAGAAARPLRARVRPARISRAAAHGPACALLHRSGPMPKTLTMAALGLMLGTIGIDPMSGYNALLLRRARAVRRARRGAAGGRPVRRLGDHDGLRRARRAAGGAAAPRRTHAVGRGGARLGRADRGVARSSAS